MKLEALSRAVCAAIANLEALKQSAQFSGRDGQVFQARSARALGRDLRQAIEEAQAIAEEIECELYPSEIQQIEWADGAWLEDAYDLKEEVYFERCRFEGLCIYGFSDTEVGDLPFQALVVRPLGSSDCADWLVTPSSCDELSDDLKRKAVQVKMSEAIVSPGQGALPLAV